MSEKSSRVVTWLRNVMYYDPISGWLFFALAFAFFVMGAMVHAPVLWLPSGVLFFVGILHFIPGDENNDR